MSPTAILDRFLDPVARCLTPDVAQQLVELRAEPQMQTRIDELASKCTEGELSEEEKSEYDTYVRAIDVITVLQSKARTVLEHAE